MNEEQTNTIFFFNKQKKKCRSRRVVYDKLSVAFIPNVKNHTGKSGCGMKGMALLRSIERHRDSRLVK
jgi:hypothetical protein